MTPDRRFASRAGDKLEAALAAFDIDIADRVCADFGCNVGGFTDCLLQRHAERVFAIDTGYGDLAWTLRNDPRVAVMERTNVLHLDPPQKVDLVVVDVAWTPQSVVLPVAARWLRDPLPDEPPRRLPAVVSLLKPHYELTKIAGRKPHRRLTPAESDDVCRTVCDALADGPLTLRAAMRSVLRGKGGNVEYLLWLTPRHAAGGDAASR